MDFSSLLQVESLIALLTLTFLEIVLGVDNIILSLLFPISSDDGF